YLARALALWRATPYLGQEQHDGIVVPMGVGVWLLRSAGLSVWVTERLWHGLLLLTTAGTTIFLVDGLRARRTVIAPPTAGLAYTLTPYVIGYGLPFTPVFLPYVLLPLLLLVTVRGVGRGGLLWPALFGLVTFLMGGGNGAPQIYVLVASITLMAWLVFAERRVSLRQALRFAAWSLVFFVGLNAYWLFLLTSPEVFNALEFSEQPNVINVTSSASEALRGLGYWALYGGDQLGPWVTTVRPYLTSPLLIFTGIAVPLGALISAWLVKWRYRLYFLLLAVMAVFVSVGVFPVPSPSPFGRFLLWSYDNIPGVAGLRTTYKVTAELNLAVAILAGIGLEALWRELAHARRHVLIRGAILALALLVIGANGYPLWMGRLYNPARGTAAVPEYWQRALEALDQRDTEHRAFFAPATYWTAYRWGSIKETVLATDPRLNAVYPLRLPIAQRYGSNLVAAIEAPYLEGAPARGTARLLRYLGVQDVVLQNDIDWVRSRTARPAELQSLLNDPELQPTLYFGRPGQHVTSESGPQIGSERALTPVQVLAVRDPVPMIRAEGAVPIVISGDGFGIATAAREDLLPNGVPLLYSGALTPAELETVLSQADPSFIVTDSNRRRVWYFSAPRAPRSYTLPAGQTIGERPIGYLLFDDRTDTQSVVVYPGVRAITASGYGSVFGTGPQFRPANAFDGDPATWWVVGTGSSPQGGWIQATLARPMLMSSLSITQPDAWWLREVRAVRLTFSDGSTVLSRLARGRTATVTFPARLTSSVRITIAVVAGNPSPLRQSGAALADIQIPGSHPAETIRVPTDLFEAANRIRGGTDRLATLPFTYLFERARSYYRGGPDEEVRISRRFEVAGTRAFTLSGRVHLNRTAGDAQLDEALFGRRDVAVTSSSRFLGDPVLRGSSALDGDPTTRWQPSGAEGEWLRIRFPRHVIDRIAVVTDAREGRDRITRIRAVFDDGTSAVGVISDPSTQV
ncbi:MAG TPA: alpha-(1-_3)-arabinofuranosyltransferase family protein, partial [Actinomycetota bacterium]|nr:alpha-(1->3)-arabinofuranosyltransferase family protein [Actinomycetota bacterium]